MSLRGHPKEAAAISPYLFAFTSTRDCFVATLLAMTYCPLLFCLMPLRGLLLPPVIASPPLADVAISPHPLVPTNPRRLLRHCFPRKDTLGALPLHVVARPSEGGRGNLTVPVWQRICRGDPLGRPVYFETRQFGVYVILSFSEESQHLALRHYRRFFGFPPQAASNPCKGTACCAPAQFSPFLIGVDTIHLNILRSGSPLLR